MSRKQHAVDHLPGVVEADRVQQQLATLADALGGAGLGFIVVPMSSPPGLRRAYGGGVIPSR